MADNNQRSQEEYINLLGYLAGIFPGFVAALPALIGEFQDIKQAGLAQNPTTLLPQDQVLKGFYKGVVDKNQVISELSQYGFSGERIDQLLSINTQGLSAGDLRAAYDLGLIDYDTYIRKMGEQGVLQEDADIYLSSDDFVLTERHVVNAWMRNLEYGRSGEDPTTELYKRGWNTEQIDLVKELAYTPPSQQDLIRMMEMNLFDPEMKETYPWMFEPPEAFVRNGKKIGISEEWAAYYWGAHFNQPGPYRLYEMYWKDLITEDDLRNALKSMGYSSWWQDRLIPNADRTPTRVDIRRFLKNGLVDTDQVKRYYLDMGYNEADAKRLTVYAMIYAGDAPQNEKTTEEMRKDELEGLTRANIQDSYEKHLISREKAYSYLTGIGLSEQVAQFYLDQSDYEMTKKRQEYRVENIETEFVKGSITNQEVISRLGDLGYSSERINALLNDWREEQNRKKEQPSKKDLKNWWKLSILDDETFKDEMALLGYSNNHIDNYLQELKMTSRKK